MEHSRHRSCRHKLAITMCVLYRFLLIWMDAGNWVVLNARKKWLQLSTGCKPTLCDQLKCLILHHRKIRFVIGVVSARKLSPFIFEWPHCCLIARHPLILLENFDGDGQRVLLHSLCITLCVILITQKIVNLQMMLSVDIPPTARDVYAFGKLICYVMPYLKDHLIGITTDYSKCFQLNFDFVRYMSSKAK